jgi:hypothetical protein
VIAVPWSNRPRVGNSTLPAFPIQKRDQNQSAIHSDPAMPKTPLRSAVDRIHIFFRGASKTAFGIFWRGGAAICFAQFADQMAKGGSPQSGPL